MLNRIILSLLFLPLSCLQGWAQDADADFPDLVPFVPTPWEVVEVMLELAQLQPGDVLYDLGSGDGRIPIQAAKKFGVRAIGIEIDSDLVKGADELAQNTGVENLVTFHQGDLFALDFSEASVITLYLFPDINLKLRPRIRSLRPGTRIISHRFDMGDWEPQATRKVVLQDGKEHSVYLWVIPDS